MDNDDVTLEDDFFAEDDGLVEAHIDPRADDWLDDVTDFDLVMGLMADCNYTKAVTLQMKVVVVM